MTDSFPRQSARTRGFNLGLPRAFAVASDGARVAFLRTPAGDDPHASLWVYDVGRGPRARGVRAAAADEERLTDEERDRRERAGEKQTGVVTFAADPRCASPRSWWATGCWWPIWPRATARELTPAGPAFDPRPDPTGTRVAYVTDGALHVIDWTAGIDRRLAHDDDPDVHWGLAEFVAAEEMGRQRGYWWAPDGDAPAGGARGRAAGRTSGTSRRLSTRPRRRVPCAIRRPARANADVTLHVVGLDGADVEVRWDRAAFEYLAAVDWTGEGPPLALVQSRDQRDVQVAGHRSGHGRHRGRCGPTTTTSGRRSCPACRRGCPAAGSSPPDTRERHRALLIDGEPVTPPGLQVIGVIDAGDDVVFSATEDPTEMHVWRLRAGRDPRRA